VIDAYEALPVQVTLEMIERAHRKWLDTPEYPPSTRIELMLEAALGAGDA